MTVTITATLVGGEQVLAALGRLADTNRSLSPLMREWAMILLRSVDKNFEEGGRPAWRPRAASTVAGMVGEFQRRARQTKGFQRAGARGRATALGRATERAGNTPLLTSSGNLRKSIVADSGPDWARVGTAARYARIQQLGGTVHLPTITPRSAQALAFWTPTGMVFARSTRPHAVTIPARPFLAVQTEDEAAIVAATTRFLGGLVNG